MVLKIIPTLRGRDEGLPRKKNGKVKGFTENTGGRGKKANSSKRKVWDGRGKNSYAGGYSTFWSCARGLRMLGQMLKPSGDASWEGAGKMGQKMWGRQKHINPKGGLYVNVEDVEVSKR